MATYETFAAVYDAVMDDSLYDLWTDFSLRHLPKTKDKKKLLELACGTGIQSVRFSQAGFDVTGLDLSADMLKIAEKRASSAKQKIDFIEGNMLDLSQAGKYDFVTCYSDSICYMQDEVEVGDVFKEVYNALNEDGVFIFDVHSTYQTDEVFPGYSYHENAEDFAGIVNCVNKGNIEAEKGSASAHSLGGIAGSNSARITGCVNEGTVEAKVNEEDSEGTSLSAGGITGDYPS